MPSIGKPVTILNSVDSSNNYAMRQVHAGLAVHGESWVALQQTAGKGQRGKSWLAKPGESILISTVLETAKLPISQQFRLSAAMSMAAYSFMAKYTGPGSSIKWPNDLYMGDRKAGGILIENIIGGEAHEIQPVIHESANYDGQQPVQKSKWKWAVVGMGINVNQTDFPEDLPNPTSLRLETGRTHDVIELVNDLLENMEIWWQRLLNEEWQSIHMEYNNHLYKRGQPVRLRKNNIVMPCTIRGVSPEGDLLIMEDEAVRFTFGEISWINNG